MSCLEHNDLITFVTRGDGGGDKGAVAKGLDSISMRYNFIFRRKKS